MGYVQGSWTPTKRRGPIAAEFTGPGPAAVALPSSIGQGDPTKSKSPSFTLSSRKKDPMKIRGPGPGAYNIAGLSNKGKATHAAPSIVGRPKDNNKFVTPAPGAYKPEKCDDFSHESQPKFSFGMKVKDSKADNTPAPNSYTIPNALGPNRIPNMVQSPSYTIAGKGRSSPPPKVPAPNAYRVPTPDSYKSKSPSFTMSPKTAIPSDKTKIPGPGAHSPEKVQVSNAPAFTFGCKHSPYTAPISEKRI